MLVLFILVAYVIVKYLFWQNEESAQAARSQIEFVEAVVEIPQKIVGWVVGKNGKTIKEIQEKAEVLRINVGIRTVTKVFKIFLRETRESSNINIFVSKQK